MMRINEERQNDMPNSGCILALPCQKLMDNPLRLNFYSEVHLGELTCSIREAGLLEPVLVWEQPDGDYMILSGHYRVHAVRRLRRSSILCRVLKCDKQAAHIAYCTSNLMTRGLSPVEQAHILSGLVTREGFTMEQAGRIWGHDKSWVCRRIKLLTGLDPKLKDELGRGTLSPRLCQELMRLPRGNEQERVLALVHRYRLNKDDAAAFVDWWLDTGEEGRKKAESRGGHPDIRNILGRVGQSCRQDNPGAYATSQLRRCSVILDGLADYLKKMEKPFTWWPQADYHIFLMAADVLDHAVRAGCSSRVKEASHNVASLS